MFSLKLKKFFNNLIIFIILMAFFKPGIMENYPFWNNIYNIYTLSISSIIIIKYFYNKKISKLQLVIMALMLFYFFTTAIGTKDFNAFFRFCLPTLAISIYSETKIKEDLNHFLQDISIICFIEILINAISIVKNPTGMYGEGMWGSYKYFMGYDNYSALTLIIGTVFIVLFNFYKNNRIGVTGIAALTLILVSYLITWSATPLIATVALIICLLWMKKTNKEKKTILRYNLFFYLSIILFVCIVLFRLQDLISYFIENILNKDLTFTGRTDIWDNSINYFLQSPFIGNGLCNFSTRRILVGIFHAHCTYLNVLIEGGIIGFTIYLIPFIMIGKKLKLFIKTKIVQIISIGFLCFFILTLMEVYEFNYVLYILINIAYYVDYINKNNNIEKKRIKEDDDEYFNN